MTDWYVVCTHRHAEAKVQVHLQRQGFDVYLPRCRRWCSHARRREIMQRPLFPRYLFVGFDIDRVRWRSILGTIGVAGILCQGVRPSRVPVGIVETIQSAETAGSFDDSSTVARMKPGDAVKIARGPFSDLAGRLQTMLAGERVCVLLDMLGRKVPTTVEMSEIAPA